MKKFTLVLFALLTLIPVSIWAEEVDGIIYSLSGSNATVTGFTDEKKNQTSITIPITISVSAADYNVTAIADNAFSGCTNLTTLKFKNPTLPTIDFAANGISKSIWIVFGGIKYRHQGNNWGNGDYFSVGNEENSAYDSETDPGTGLIIYPQINNIPVTEIKRDAFINKEGTLTIGNNITTISDLAFSNTSYPNKLTSITVDNGNQHYESHDGILYKKTESETLELVTCPENLSPRLGSTISWPSGITSIGKHAFLSQKNLVNITIPSTVRSIGQSAFQYAGSTVGSFSISFGSGSLLQSIGNSAFQESALSTIALPSELTTIGETAFYKCSSLGSITLPSSLTTIGASAFRECNSLIITFAPNYNGLTIANNAFYNCKLSETIEIPNGVTSIGSKSFNVSETFKDGHGSELTTFRIPSSVTSYATDAVDEGVTVQRNLGLDFGTGKYLTYYSTIDVALPEGLHAYQITGMNENNTLITAAVNYIPRNHGVLLELDENTNLNEWFNTYSGSSADFTDNKLVGSTTGISNISMIVGDKYVLEGDKFVKVHQGSLSAFRCYLVLNNGEGAQPSTIYLKKNDNNAYIILKEGQRVNYSVGTASLSDADGGLKKLTVIPHSDYYSEKKDITIRKNISATTARAPSININIDNTTWNGDDLTIVSENTNPNGTIEYTFDPNGATVFEVTVDFHECINIADGNKHTVNITLEQESYPYNGLKQNPGVTKVLCDGNEMEEDTDYTVSHPTDDNTNKNASSTAVVYINGKGKYMGTYNKYFTITKRNIDAITVTPIEDQTYTGSDITPTLNIKDIIGERELNIAKETDYTIQWANNTNVNLTNDETKNGKVTFTGTGNYTGTKDVYFKIVPKEMTSENIADIPAEDYTGSAITPQLTITYLNNSFVKEEDYHVEFSNNTKSGEATATITFNANYNGNYTGTVTKTFIIKDHAQHIQVEFDNPNNQWTTYYSTENLALAEGLLAYVVTGLNGRDVQITSVDFIPKDTPVLLYSESGQKSFELQTCYSATPPSVTPSNKFVGITEDVDISTISGTKFILLNGNFVQTSEGTLKANRCYFVTTEVPTGVTTLTIGKNVNDITILNDLGNVSTTVGTVIENPKGTLTITPKNGYYITSDGITIIRNTSAGSARAPQIEEGKMTVTPGNITNNNDYTSTYIFTYDYTEGYQYQIITKFLKSENLSDLKPIITLNYDSYEYDKSEKKPMPTVILGGVELKKDVAYVVSYQSNKNAGKGNVLINGIRKYTNELNKEFTITKRNINNHVTVIVDEENLIYTGNPIEPLTITDMVGEEDIINSDEYTITYDPESHTNAGIVKYTIEGKNNYTAKKEGTFEIMPKNLTGKVTIDDIAPIEETGDSIKPRLVIKDGSTELNVNEDYTVAYKDNVKDGTAKAIISFIGNYTGIAEKEFTIKHKIEPVTLNIQFDDNNKWTTFYGNDFVSVPEGLKAYIIVGLNGKDITPKEADFIPEEVPVLLYREDKNRNAPFIGNTMPSDTKLSDDIKPYSGFHGTLESLNIATISGSKFILLNNQFIQTTEGTLPANRCYINATVDGVAALAIGKAIDEHIYLEEGKPSTAGGTAETSTPSEKGIITLTVKPKTNYYAEAKNITIVSSAIAKDARAPQIDGSNVEITPIDENADPSGITKYTFKYSEGYHYQIAIDFQKCTNFSIKENQPTVTLDRTSFVYDGTEKKPKATVVFGDKTLKENTDYVLSFKNNINAGAANVVLKGKGYYSGEFSGTTFNITRRTINSNQVKVEIKEKAFTYTGKPIEPKLIITESIKIGEEIVNIITTEDFKVFKYDNNTNASTNEKKAMIAIEGIRNYKDIKDVYFEILPKELSINNVQAIPDQDYTGEPIEPELIIKDGDYTLKLDDPDDYDVEFSNNLYEGTANVNITFKNNYKGTAKTTFKIKDKVHQRSLNIEFDNQSEWTTFFWHENLEIKDQGLTAYVVTGHEDGKTKLITEEVNFIPANVGVLLHRANNSNVGPFYGITLPINTELTGVTPNNDLYVGTLKGIEDLSMIDGVKFILVNDQFVQVAEGTLPANRCYVNFGDAEGIEGISNIITNKDVDAIIIQNEGKENKVGTASLSDVQDGKKTLTVEPFDGFFAELNNITVIRSVSGESARAAQVPSVENSKVTVTANNPSDDPSKKTTYSFPYEEGYHYQITVDFQKRFDFSKSETQTSITFDTPNFEYNGKEHKPTNIVVKKDDIIIDPSNYTISYEDNIDAGPSYVVITGKRYFTGIKKQEFIITQRNIKQVTVKDIPDQEYTGSPITPTLDITDIITEGGSSIIDESQYDLVFENNTEVGRAKVNIVAKKINYHNTKVVYFNIIPATGIDHLTLDEQEGQWYDLNGQRIIRPTQKGIYILRDKNKKMKKIRVK